MEGVADKTGGDTLKGGNAGEDFREMMRRIRQRYSSTTQCLKERPANREWCE